MVRATSNKESVAFLASLKHYAEHIDVKYRQWTHHYSLSREMASFSVMSRFFLTAEEVELLTRLGKEAGGVEKLLGFFSPDGAGTYSVEQNSMITNWVWYWKTHNTII